MIRKLYVLNETNDELTENIWLLPTRLWYPEEHHRMQLFYYYLNKKKSHVKKKKVLMFQFCWVQLISRCKPYQPGF